MEDFIRPNHNPEPKLKPKKTKHIRETLFIVCMIVCLAVGFVSGYVAKKQFRLTVLAKCRINY